MRKRPEKTARTKAELEEAFWRLYAKRPIEKITVQQVCDLAGYNRATFYLHYHDLYELLATIEAGMLEGMTRCVEACMKRLADDSSKAARIAALGEVVLFYERHRSRIVVLLGAQGDPSFIVALKDQLKPLWRQYVIGEAIAEHTETEIDLILEYTLAGTLFMISRWLQDPGDISSLQIGRLIYDAAIRDVSLRANS
jgi:AcrR family transcriptional regulator